MAISNNLPTTSLFICECGFDNSGKPVPKVNGGVLVHDVPRMTDLDATVKNLLKGVETSEKTPANQVVSLTPKQRARYIRAETEKLGKAIPTVAELNDVLPFTTTAKERDLALKGDI